MSNLFDVCPQALALSSGCCVTGECYRFSGVSQPEVSFELKANSVRTQAKGKRHLAFQDGTDIEIVYPTYYMRGLMLATFTAPT